MNPNKDLWAFIQVTWSDEDDVFIAKCLGDKHIEGLMTHGDTVPEALSEMSEVLGMVMEDE